MKKKTQTGLLSAFFMFLFIIKVKLTKDKLSIDKNINSKFNKFNELLTIKTAIEKERYLNLRNNEIYDIITNYNIQHIVEMGTGRTTFFFNTFNNVKVVSYEQDKNWKTIVEEIFNKLNLKKPIINLSKVEKYRDGARFANLRKNKCDLLYIDGPYIKNDKSQFNPKTGKAAYYDYEFFLKTKSKPKIIMVEGRLETVDAILNSVFASYYNFYPEFIYSLMNKDWYSCFNLKRHSLFILKTDYS